MDDIVKLSTNFLSAVALIMALVLIISIVQRQSRRYFLNGISMCLLFSLAVLFTMSDPIDIGAAGQFDMRGLIIGAGAALIGPYVGLCALITAITYRLYLGGPGLESGLISVTCVYVGALIWIKFVRPRKMHQMKKSVLLGGLMSAQTLGIVGAPPELIPHLVQHLFPYILTTNIVGILLINYLISGELSFQSEAETSRLHANTDHLTGLLNRRGLEEVYPSTTRNTDRHKGRALLYFDIDNFKAFNDAHGHKIGDDVLCYVTDRISANLRPNDVFARLGGDEFAVILNQIDAKEAKHIAERCRSVVADGAFMSEGDALDISVSIGAIWMLEHTEIDRIMDQADKALYAAKAKGRNKVVFKHAQPVPCETNAVLA